MKLLKLASLTLMATVTFGVYNANAGIGITTNTTALNVSLTITTNVPEVLNGHTWTWKTKTVKISNKNLIEIFSHWSTNAFATANTKLVIGWDSPWSGDVLVVDKTGTNVIFDASNNSHGESAYFYVDWMNNHGAGSGKQVNDSPGSYSFIDSNGGYFQLYDNGVYLPYTDLWSNGFATVNFTQNWDKNGDYTKWNASAQFKSLGEGDQYLFDVGSDTTTSATISANGSGKGSFNYFNN